MKRYGLIGYPLSHSFSEKYFANKFQQEGITGYTYQNFPLENIGEIEQLVAANPDLKGLNVTIPYKEKVLPYLSGSNDIVKSVGACNTIRIDNGKLFGFNTDVIGFEKSLLKELAPHHRLALILGEGGAAKAVAFVLQKLNIDFKYVVRKGETSNDRILYSDLADETLASHTLIVNSTPVGMYPHLDECPPLNYDIITSNHYLYDLIYNPEKTKFLQLGQQKAATIKNGYEMLVLQAEESWRIWNEPMSR